VSFEVWENAFGNISAIRKKTTENFFFILKKVRVICEGTKSRRQKESCWVLVAGCRVS
jgi:hypothetical protein